AYGIVWKAIEKKSKDTVAVKKIFDAFRNQTDAQRTFREIMFLLSFANHENIIKLIGLHKADNDRDIYLVFEYMETDLHNVIKRGNILKDIHKVFIMYQLFKAIKYIHSGNVIHRDLKPSNVLLNAQCHCKIADFGLARSVTQIGEGDGETGNDPTLTDYVATRWYRAPEILIASKSAGYGTNLLEKTPNRPRRTLKDLLPEVSEKALDLISNLIVFNPTQRFTAVEALEHPYVADFHRRGNEPERGSSVIPLLSDDVQLSVDEYRNKLYAMMDEKHRKHKNMSKSRLRRLSESIRKETRNSSSNPVIGQGDTIVACSSLPSKKTIRPSQSDNTPRGVTRTQTMNNPIDPPQETLINTRHNVRNMATQYACKLTNGNIPPAAAKSCFYFNQQQLSKSQRSIQSDQMAMYGIRGRSNQLTTIAQRTKPRRVSRQQILTQAPRPFSSASANCRGDNHWSKKMPTKLIRISDSPNTIKQPNNVAKTVVRTMDVRTTGVSSPESPCIGHQSQAIRNYFNQVPLLTQQQPQVRNRTSCRGRDNNFVNKSFVVDTMTINNCFKNATRGQGSRLHAKHSFDVNYVGQKRPSTCNKSRFLNSHSQSHGVIAESVYKDLCNGTIGW
ncbi:Putative serine/threonine-protein kinase C05D10.2, partial [Acromyrmex echinatior]